APDPEPDCRLGEALAGRDEIRATAWALRLLRAGRKADLWRLLLECATRHGVECTRLVVAMWVRFGQGALPGGRERLVAGAGVSCCRLRDEQTLPEGWERTELPWEAI